MQIRGNARALADQVNSTFISDDQANYWIDQARAGLWDLLVTADPDRYITTPHSISTTAGTYVYALPATCYKVRALWHVRGTNWRTRVMPVPISEAPRYMHDHIPSISDDEWYYLRGDNIVFLRDPGGESYELLYVPAPGLFASDVDFFDGIAGWEDWIEYTVAIQMMNKEEADSSFLVREREKIEARIRKTSSDRDSAAPKVADTFNRMNQYWRTA